jgi:uncharacterized repeat protein (TIGR01451 family)
VREETLRSTCVLLVLIVVGLSLAFGSLSMEGQASGSSGTGVGIREEGPQKAQVEETIDYTITVCNLGDYSIREAIVTDILPNGTALSWNIPGLAPMGQAGDSFTISGIAYTIRDEDVIAGPPLNIQNYAEVSGYSDVGGLRKTVYASTDYPTIILKPPVACFTVSKDVAYLNENVTFDASCSHDPDGWIVKYEWDWEGDGVYDFVTNNPVANHQYAKEGVYYPKLRVTDNDGLTDETARKVFVYSIPVGGYSVSAQNANTQTTHTIYSALLFIITIALACAYVKTVNALCSLTAPTLFLLKRIVESTCQAHNAACTVGALAER